MKRLRISLRHAAVLFVLGMSSVDLRAEGLGIEPPYTNDSIGSTLLGRTLAARVWDDLQAKKNALIPATVGAWHWWRLPTGGPGNGGYGSDTLPGTFYYYLMLDPMWNTGREAISSFGLHAELRFRDDGAFRPWMKTHVWPYETYAWMNTKVGLFKIGQIQRKFGLAWDGSFYGNTAYYDGLKLNADLGVAWERTFWVGRRFSVESSAQFFLREDGISNALIGAGSESTSTFELQNNAVLRVVPTWWFNEKSSLALGLSGSLGQVKSNSSFYPDHSFAAWGVDLTYTRDRFKVFGEVLQTHGALTPWRYASGSMSSRVTNVLAGMSYTTGPLTWRVAWSAGYDHAPSGRQQMFVPGVTLALTKNADLYIEYVKWTVRPSWGAPTTFENGLQIALNWRF